MTVTISTAGDLRLDQTSGIQSGGTPDKDDIALTSNLSALPDPFEAFLESLSPSLTTDQLANATTYGGAMEDPNAGYFINVTTDGEPVDDLFFSKSDGTLFNGEIATYTDSSDVTHNITVAGSTDPIYLYSFMGGDVLIGSTEAPAGVDIADPATLDASQIVFAYYLAENDTHTGADAWGITFYPLEHFVDGSSGDALDDAIDLGDFLNVTATGEVSFEFDNLRSGKFLWVALGTESAGLLLTGRDLNVQSGGNKDGQRVSGTNDPSDAVNTSQGGIGATTGINNQMYTPGSVGVITFVAGLDVLSSGTGEASGDNVKDITYDDFINVSTAGVFISQTQGNGTVNMTVSLHEADADNNPANGLQAETSFAYIGAEGGNNNTSGAFQDDDPVNVASVDVYIGNKDTGTLVGTWDSVNSGTTINGVTVTISNNQATFTGLSAGMEVYLSSGSGETFNRLQVAADPGTTSFDIGRVDLDQAATDVQNIGGSVLIHDDPPTITVDDASGDFDAGVLGNWNHDPGTDTFASLSVTLDTYAIGDGSPVTADVSLGTKTATEGGNYVFEGSITADFTPNDGINNPQTIDFVLTMDPDEPETYDLQLETPPSTITKFDTSQGSLPAGGPDAVQTLGFAPTGHTNDVIFFGVVATAPSENGTTASDPDSIEELVNTNPTEAFLESLNVPTLINAGAQMNVSTSGIGINNNNLNGADEGTGSGAFAGTSITSGDQSFVVNPEQDVDTVRVYIDNAVGGYTPTTEDLYYVIYYTDGTVSGPLEVTAAMLSPVPKQDPLGLWPDAAQGGKYFDIESGDKQIEAVQLTMGLGVVKIPVIEFIVETDFNPSPLTLNFTAELFDDDGDSSSDSFSIDLVDSTV
ncbi:hypothetical protein [Aestuariivirga sp.]|uniref:hypothetical protein n=1 Tax=Aestuariivirga sp. TaxID=2650926 RepID=UPI003918DC1F